MTEQEIRTILNRQREYFATGATLSRKFRAEQLGKLKASLQRHEEELNAALQQDLGKKPDGELYVRDRTDALGADLDAETSAGADAGKESADTAVTVRSDKLSLSVTLWHRADHEPWNYPVLLTLDPLIDAHSCRKYGGGEAQCICSGDGSCAEKYSGRMFSDRIRGCDHRRQNGESGIIAAAV